MDERLPIEYTSDESKKKQSTIANYLYARYALIGIIGSLVFLAFSFGGGNSYLYAGLIFVAILAMVELRRTDIEEAMKKKNKSDEEEENTHKM